MLLCSTKKTENNLMIQHDKKVGLKISLNRKKSEEKK